MSNDTAQSLLLADESATLKLGETLGRSGRAPAVIYLQGPLGAGKTTLVRGILRGGGYQGRVKSPTYTLVEPYELGELQLYHFDLYRLGDPGELEFIGLREFFHETSVCLIEWPERGEGILPEADLQITLNPEGSGRRVTLKANSAVGDAWLAPLLAAGS
jgi:tRNA threonylcarbamoyladenosine biosynthesis protein TsaE